MATIKWLAKDPEEVLDYEHDWGPLLQLGEAVTDPPRCEVPVESGLAVDSTVMNGSRQTVWLSGGIVGNYHLTISIDTDGGRTFEEGIKLSVKER